MTRVDSHRGHPLNLSSLYYATTNPQCVEQPSLFKALDLPIDTIASKIISNKLLQKNLNEQLKNKRNTINPIAKHVIPYEGITDDYYTKNITCRGNAIAYTVNDHSTIDNGVHILTVPQDTLGFSKNYKVKHTIPFPGICEDEEKNTYKTFLPHDIQWGNAHTVFTSVMNRITNSFSVWSYDVNCQKRIHLLEIPDHTPNQLTSIDNNTFLIGALPSERSQTSLLLCDFRINEMVESKIFDVADKLASVSVSQKNPSLFATGMNNGTVKIYDIRKNIEDAEIITILADPINYAAMQVSWNPYSSTELVAGGGLKDGTLHSLNIQSEEPIHQLKIAHAITRLLFTENNTLATTLRPRTNSTQNRTQTVNLANGNISFYHLNTEYEQKPRFQNICSFNGTNHRHTNLGLLPDNNLLVTAGSARSGETNGYIQLWDLTDPKNTTPSFSEPHKLPYMSNR